MAHKPIRSRKLNTKNCPEYIREITYPIRCFRGGGQDSSEISLRYDDFAQCAPAVAARRRESHPWRFARQKPCSRWKTGSAPVIGPSRGDECQITESLNVGWSIRRHCGAARRPGAKPL